MAQSDQEILTVLADVVSEETGIEPAEVTPEKSFAGDLDIDAQPAGAPGGLVLVEVHLAGLAVHDLAGTSELEPLLGTRMGLHLRHSLLLVLLTERS